MDLTEFRVLVTGAAQGIGKHIVQSLCGAGAKVAGIDVNRKGLQELKSEIGGLAGSLSTHLADVGNEEDVKRAVAAAARELSSINGLINNAGIYRDGLLVRKMPRGTIRFPLAQWDAVVRTDLTGTFLMTREVAAHMVDKGVNPGIIINISSISRHGNPGQSPYSAAKAGVVAATRTWARELCNYGIRVGCIAPGFIRTPALDAMAPETLKEYVSKVPLQRIGEPEEIMRGIQFIVECDYFTGRCIDIDGGFDF